MDDPDTLLRTAAALFRAGRYAEAVPAYQALLAVKPDLPNSWFNLAFSQRRIRAFAEALASYQRALDLGIDGPEEVHLQRGVILSDDLGQSDTARAEIEAALALNPDYVAALLNLGNLHEDLGDREAAHRAYARAHAIDPNDALALARLLSVSSEDEGLIARVRTMLANPRATAGDRADLGFALGRTLDRRGEYDAAFAAYQAANQANRTMLDAMDARYDAVGLARYVDAAVAAFPWPTASGNHEAPIFIAGMYRSGSTLAETILACHSKISAGGELDLIPALLRQLPTYPNPPAPETLETLAAAYAAEAEPRRAPGTRLTDKRPDSILHIGLIKALFPRAKIVRTVRNPRDTCLSVWFLQTGPAIPYATDLTEIADYHARQERLAAHWKTLWPGDIHDLDYDRLVREPRAEIAALLDFLGLEWEDAVLDSPAAPGAVRTASNWQVREPLYRESSGRWRNYAAHLDKLLD